ncbi:glycosyltransferase family 1 protein [Mycolicibacterium sp. P1-18]|uniref:glycosyltransferase family 4 protein n=1 Tax=Mycolicibacterium sp. P1-18 TaxID=2024615 RepID=UPI001F5B3E02|nr:glycosyltransferase family 1 protein [Mycolicibacterium sp. P1-18]
MFADRGLVLAVLVDRDKMPHLRATTRVVESRPANAPMYSRHEQRAWNAALAEIRPRSMWVPHYPFPLALLRPRNRRTRFFVTVHDLLHVQSGDVTGQNSAFRAYARTMLNLDVRRAARIFTPSHTTAGSLTAVAPAAPVTVTPLPVEQTWFTAADLAASPVAGRYVLYVGNTKWHKNLTVLLKAFGDVARSLPQNLVIAGGGALVKNSDERVDQLVDAQADRVRIVGRVDFASLRALVAGADLLVMPSLYEGVGLPPLEAMASHTAVLASNIPSLRETCGDGADYFDPHDDGTLGELLVRYGTDDAARDELAERGWARVTQRQDGISLTAAAEVVCAELAGAPL